MVDYLGLRFQGSNDYTTWTDLFEVTYFTQNFWVQPEQNAPQQFRYLRFYNTLRNGSTTANCEVSELAIYGRKFYKNDVTSLSQDIACQVNVFSNGIIQNFASNPVTYQSS